MYNNFNNFNPQRQVGNGSYDTGNQQTRWNQLPLTATTDYGPSPFVVDIKKAVAENDNFRTVLWTGNHLQLTIMSIPAGGEIGLEMHPNVDQFLRIEEGQGLALMGRTRNDLYLRQHVFDDTAIIIPAGAWHNIVNTGCRPLKLYSLYAPPNHPWGTVHQTKEIADAAEHHGF